MEELIKIKESDGGKQVVSAKEIHSFLESDTRFDIWIKRMMEYGFTESVDYQCLNKTVPMPNGGNKESIYDYAITLDCAKEIAMIQRTEKGKQARQYFIECEKKLKEVSIPQTYAQALLEAGRLALELEEKNAQLQIMQPKADFFDAVTDSKDAIEIGKVAKVIDLGMGRNQLFEFLRSRNILMRDNVPYQRYIDQELFRVIEQKYQKPDGSTCIGIKTLVFQKGVDYIIKLVKEINN
jgi:anti-repressor protein